MLLKHKVLLYLFFMLEELKMNGLLIGDKSNFVKLEIFDGGVVRFGDDQTARIVGIGSINFDGIHNNDSVFYVKGLNHNLLIIGQMCENEYNLAFQDDGCEIRKMFETVIVEGKRTYGNIY